MKRIGVVFVSLLLIFLLGGCGNRQNEINGTKYQIYEMNKEETTIRSRDFVTEETKKNRLLGMLLSELQKTPDNTEYKQIIVDPVKLVGFSINDETAVISFSDKYDQLSLTAEVLLRAALVKTLTQIDGINYVSVLVDDTPLVNRSGVPVGMMTAEQFIDNSGNEINTEEKVNLTLYYSNPNGDKLIKINRQVVYNGNISLEKLVMEQLIVGTYAEELEQTGASMTLSPDTKVNSIVVSDGSCYVNLDSSFLTQNVNENPEVIIYSIVNSLVELPNINKVQFSIDGENSIMYKEMLSFSETYERNLEIVEDK